MGTCCIDSELSSALCDGLEEWDEGEGGREVLEGGNYMHTLPTKVRLVKAMVFPAVLFGCESWTVKKAEQ